MGGKRLNGDFKRDTLCSHISEREKNPLYGTIDRAKRYALPLHG